MPRGGAFGFLMLIGFGAIIADVEAHPKGTQAGLGGLGGILKNSWQAAAGQPIK